MESALLGALAGMCFGALTVAVRWATRRGADPEIGAFVTAALAAAALAIAAAPLAVAEGIDADPVVPFLAVGLIAPGASQIALTSAVGHAGPSRAAILMGSAPLLSVAAALALLDEPFRPPLVLGTALIVAGGVALALERPRPERFRARGAALAILCAALFATRDTVARWTARDEHPPLLLASAATLTAAAALIYAYFVFVRRRRIRAHLVRALPAFAPAAAALAAGYTTLFAALDRGNVSVVSPLNATGSLWAVAFAALVIGRTERIGRRTVIAAALVVAGGALIGVFR